MDPKFQENVRWMKIGGAKVPKWEGIQCLRTIIQNYDGIKEDMDHKITVGWKRWKIKSRVLCTKRMPIRLKVMCYMIVVWLTMLHGTKH